MNARRFSEGSDATKICRETGGGQEPRSEEDFPSRLENWIVRHVVSSGRHEMNCLRVPNRRQLHDDSPILVSRDQHECLFI
jgi:hypothetical protein